MSIARMLGLLLLASCATAEHGRRVLEIETACYFPCDAFEVAVYEDGWVDLAGRHGKQVSRRQLAAVDAVIRSSGWPTFDPKLFDDCPEDAGRSVTIRYGGQALSTSDWCDKRYAVTLLGRIVTLLDLDSWVTE